MNIKETYLKLRSMYRKASREFSNGKRDITDSIELCSALRALTNNWDAGLFRQSASNFEAKQTSKGKRWILHVSLAQQRWIKSH